MKASPTTHREIHNVYGQLMSRATFEGLGAAAPERAAVRADAGEFRRRPALRRRLDRRQHVRLVIAAAIRFHACWVWAFPVFRLSGSDIGGFAGAPSGELYTRWLQFGVFSPFMRAHTRFDSRRTRSRGRLVIAYEAINKRAIELRYELLPYIYNVMQQASETGVPALRPLFLEFPDDEHVAGMDDEFLFGADLLVAPVLHEGATGRDVYLPAGDWFDYWTGRRFAGNRTIPVPVTLDSIPMFVRGGGFVFRQPVVQSTDEMPGNALRVLIAPGQGIRIHALRRRRRKPAYRKGDFMKRQFHQLRDGGRTTLKFPRRKALIRPAARSLALELWSGSEPKNVSLEIGDNPSQKIELPRLTPDAMAGSTSGWSFTNGQLIVKDADHFEPMRFTIEN